MTRDGLVKALGRALKGHHSKWASAEFWDLSFGLGKDALKVKMCFPKLRYIAFERNQAVYDMFLSQVNPEASEELAQVFSEEAFSLRCKEFRPSYLPRSSNNVQRILYYDPMFSDRSDRSALPKKEMQWLREQTKDESTLHEKTALIENLLQVDFRGLYDQLIVKNHDKGDKVFRPDKSFKSKITRYDVYL